MFSKNIDREPTSFEIWVLKWIAMPIVVLALSFGVLSYTKENLSCRSYCLENGFETYKFFSATRGNSAKCYCYPTSETHTKEAFDSRVLVEVPE